MAHRVLSTFDSILSSARLEASLFRDVGAMLAQYLPQHEGDKTLLVLETFLSELPTEGLINLRQNIHDCNSDQQLRDLATYLVFHILTPCTFLLTSLPFLGVLSKL